MACQNIHPGKYYCQHAHRTEKCSDKEVRRLCMASCSCSDDRYHASLGRYASKDCRASQFARSNATLLVLNSNQRSFFASSMLNDLQSIGPPVLVVYGLSPTSGINISHPNLASLYVRHDSIDFTAIIALIDFLPQLQKWTAFDRIFYFHDTMRIVNTTRFTASLRSHDLVRTCSLQMGQSMNIGMYAISDLVRQRRFLETVRGPTSASRKERLALKKRGMRGVEGALFDRSGAWAKYNQCGCELSKGPNKGPVKDGRIELWYKEWGLLKYQSYNRTYVFE